MNISQIKQILDETAYVRTGGSDTEKRCADYLEKLCREMGLRTHQESFEVDMASIEQAELWVDGEQIPCKGYFCAGNAEVEAPLYYLPSTDPHSLSLCKGKIVMIDTYLGYWIYRDLLDNGAVGFITYSGDMTHPNDDIDQRELRSYVSKGDKIPGINLNVKSAVKLIEQDAKTARILLRQNEYKGTSQNVIAELPGETDEVVVLTAHYDSTSLSTGAYDNMSGCIGLLGIAEYFRTCPHRYGMRFVFCGSEERGLLGSKAYVAAHEEDLKKAVLNINLDMIGCTMGKFIACCTAEEKLVHYISYLSCEAGFGVSPYQGVYSSDSTPFADQGIPAVSFARIAPSNTATIHNRFDTLAVMKPEQVQRDVDFLISFTDRMVCAARCPVAREMPDNMKEKLDHYLCRKRSPKK